MNIQLKLLFASILLINLAASAHNRYWVNRYDYDDNDDVVYYDDGYYRPGYRRVYDRPYYRRGGLVGNAVAAPFEVAGGILGGLFGGY